MFARIPPAVPAGVAELERDAGIMTADRRQRFRRVLGLIALTSFGLGGWGATFGGATAQPADGLEGFVVAANDTKKPAAKGAKSKTAASAKSSSATGAAKPATAAPKPQQTASAPPVTTVMERAQMLLTKKGRFSGKIDGEASPAMGRALLAYQAEQGLPQTGRLDAATIGRMGISKP